MSSSKPNGKPRLLDLFCGAGGAGMGYHRAGFEVVGVDLHPQPCYPFEFYQADAMTYPLEGFNVIHASPPCQFYSHLTPAANRSDHPDLINLIRKRLLASIYVIENVAGARQYLRDPLMLCGSMFGLACYRHRFFESTITVNAPKRCNHDFRPLLVTTASKASRAIRQPGQYKSVRNAPLAYGINWMTFTGLKEAIPPAYTEYIGLQLMASLGKLNK